MLMRLGHSHMCGKSKIFYPIFILLVYSHLHGKGIVTCLFASGGRYASVHVEKVNQQTGRQTMYRDTPTRVEKGSPSIGILSMIGYTPTHVGKSVPGDSAASFFRVYSHLRGKSKFFYPSYLFCRHTPICMGKGIVTCLFASSGRHTSTHVEKVRKWIT